MAANVKVITPPHVAQNQHLQRENVGLREANAVMAAKLAELGVDAQALVNAHFAGLPSASVVAPVAAPAPAPAPTAATSRPLAVPTAPAARPGIPLDPPSGPRAARPPQFAEAQVGGARVTARPAATSPRGPAIPIVAGPAPRMPGGVPAGSGGPIITNPDGSTVQLLPNVTRNAHVRAPAAPVAPVAPVAAPPVAPPPAPAAPPRVEIVTPAAPPSTLDEDARARFSLLEID